MVFLAVENHRDATVEMKKKAVDMYMLKQRLYEERPLIKTDMRNFLQFYSDIRDALKSHIEQLPQVCDCFNQKQMSSLIFKKGW